ncbi:tRNA-binding protein [Maricaulis sp.]|uniref:tRNA-binding protein n=1 Tax=Maricaulis sp. TaxID=1486257 RepID=UPI003A8D4F32
MTKAQIVYDDFARVEMRLGRIVEALEFPKARNPSYKLCVDFGDFGTRWSSAQITNYAREELVGRRVVCVVNMPPRNIAGFLSEVLILGVPNAAGAIILLTTADDAVLGGEVA